jgi:hypothetical protein
MRNLYLLHIYPTLLLHVSVYLTPSSGRTYVFLLKTICFYTAIIYGILAESLQIKDTNLLVYNVFKLVKILCVACCSVCYKP